MQVADTGSLYSGIISVPSSVITVPISLSSQCPDTGISFYSIMAVLLSCHPSAQTLGSSFFFSRFQRHALE
ncbi:hypothetical protein [Wolbachia endosymbiont (group A) of Agelastica alni]|uniref:hypothetical protein n=1 Tax=Wolbachia endosymbiont (group A) of Agelastica alni TaxID=3066130 RepID=UPI00333F1DE3